MHVMIVECYHPLLLSACMLNFDLVSILFGTSIPTSFMKMFLYLFHWFVATCINLLAFVLPPLHTYEDSQQLAGSDSYILSCTNIAHSVQQRVQCYIDLCPSFAKLQG